MENEEALNLECRRRIYDCISQSPGVHLRELQRLLAIQMGSLEYHLTYMEKRGLLASRADGHYTRYYTKDKFDPMSKSILSFLRQDLPRCIILFLMMNPGATHGRVLETLDVTGATLSYHMKRMGEAGVVKALKKGRETEFTVSEPERVADLLITYKRSFMDRLVDSFVSAWLARE